MTIIENGCCPFCLSQNGGNLKPDKKGRPFFTCVACGTKAFIRITQVAETFAWILSNGTKYSMNMPKVEKTLQIKQFQEVR